LLDARGKYLAPLLLVELEGSAHVCVPSSPSSPAGGEYEVRSSNRTPSRLVLSLVTE
jgi:hypothetical protein